MIKRRFDDFSVMLNNCTIELEKLIDSGFEHVLGPYSVYLNEEEEDSVEV